MIVNGEHGVGVGEFMEMDAYVRAGRGTCGPRGDGVVMISVRSLELALSCFVHASTKHAASSRIFADKETHFTP